MKVAPEKTEAVYWWAGGGQNQSGKTKDSPVKGGKLPGSVDRWRADIRSPRRRDHKKSGEHTKGLAEIDALNRGGR